MRPEHRSLRREEKMFSISAMTATNPRQLKFRDFSRENLWRRADTRAYISDLQIHHPVVREIILLYPTRKIRYVTYYLNFIISTNGNVTHIMEIVTRDGVSKNIPFRTEASSPNYVLTSV